MFHGLVCGGGLLAAAGPAEAAQTNQQTASRYDLELDGKHVGWVLAIEGGHAKLKELRHKLTPTSKLLKPANFAAIDLELQLDDRQVRSAL